MKCLHFYSVAAHSKVAPALMRQAENTLQPFRRFLGQAIYTAKQRQTRYQLPWKRVRDIHTVRLSPMDSVVQVARRPPGVVLADWPADRATDLSQKGFVAERGLVVEVLSATKTADGLVVQTAPLLQASDKLIWCAVTSSTRREAALPPTDVRDVRHQPLTLVSPPRATEDGRWWTLIIEGNLSSTRLIIDGEELNGERLSAFEGLQRVIDTDGRSFEAASETLRDSALPSAGELKGDNGVRFRWTRDGDDRRGFWVQLLAPETSDTDEWIDPRAAFCEGDIQEIWTQPRRSESTTFKVKKVDQDRYQLLLDRYPPDGSTLYLPLDLRNLYLQSRALRQLTEAPLPHHQGLLRLCEDPDRVRWPSMRPSLAPIAWRSLTDPTRDGTEEQRRFVEKALRTPDFAFLEGPPGSGKTTAICELIQQLVARGERVLLCASTHVAIDNVLERILATDSSVDAVRIGKIEKVDDRVQQTQLDERIRALLVAWREQPSLRSLADRELEQMAERTVVMAANLTCGTTMGIVNHPLFRGRDEDRHVAERPIATMPHWDVLIVDEASKTLIQEFMVPALMARRWIVVGDVRQLPPFADRAGIVANLRDLVDKRERSVFSTDHQRARLLLFRLRRPQIAQIGLRWLIVERPGVLESIQRELDADPAHGLTVARVVARPTKSTRSVTNVTLEQLENGTPEALHVVSADWVLVCDDMIRAVAPHLPNDLLIAEELTGTNRPLHEAHPLFTRQAWALQRVGDARNGRLSSVYSDRDFRFETKRERVETFADAQQCERWWLERHDFAQELAWRITRVHELRDSRNERELERLDDDIERLLPDAVDVSNYIEEIEDIGLPSILEVIQEGIGEERSNRRSSLTAGMRSACEEDFAARFESLTFQHRMHADISAFARAVIYEGNALRDANTVQQRDERLRWSFGPFPVRRAWSHVAGREHSGVNESEVAEIERILRAFVVWAKRNGPPARESPACWEVACLCFYVKQEGALSNMLRKLTEDDRRTRFRVRDAPVEIVCGTVDRFQGREADLVLLSMRNTRRVGFLDSPNRLNVAVTRARQQLIIVGDQSYFSGCAVSELKALAERTPSIADDRLPRSRP